MKRWFKVFILGACFYMLFLVITLPAQKAYQWLKPQLNPLSLEALQGTVWSGQAKQAFFNGVPIGTLHWQFRSTGLLTGNIDFDIIQEADKLQNEAIAGTNITGDISIRELTGFIDAPLLKTFSNVDMIDLAGEVTYKMAFIKISNQRIQEIEGDIYWDDASIVQPLSVELGRFHLSAYTDDSNHLIQIAENDGPLEADGYVILEPDGHYNLSVNLNPTANAPQQIVNALRTFGQVNQDGKIEFNYSDQL